MDPEPPFLIWLKTIESIVFVQFLANNPFLKIAKNLNPPPPL